MVTRVATISLCLPGCGHRHRGCRVIDAIHFTTRFRHLYRCNLVKHQLWWRPCRGRGGGSCFFREHVSLYATAFQPGERAVGTPTTGVLRWCGRAKRAGDVGICQTKRRASTGHVQTIVDKKQRQAQKREPQPSPKSLRTGCVLSLKQVLGSLWLLQALDSASRFYPRALALDHSSGCSNCFLSL
jgi:hypothetical protein